MPQAIRVVDRLQDQADVTVSSPSNGQLLTYNSTSGKWENATAAGGVSLSSATPSALAPTGAAGTATGAAHADHVHPSTTLDALAFGHRTLQSGSYYTIPFLGNTSNGGYPLNTILVMPFWLGIAATFDRLAFNVTFASTTGGVCRLGIYNSDGAVPTSLVLDAGTVGTTSTGVKQITISQALQPGMYWLAVCSQVAQCNGTLFQGYYPNRGLTNFVFTWQNGPSTQQQGVSGALPSTYSETAWTTTAAVSFPQLYLRAA